MAKDIEMADKDSNIMAALACFFGGIIAIVIYLIKKDDRFVKFYALQEIIFQICFSAIAVVAYIAMIGGMFAGPLISILGAVAGGTGGAAGAVGAVASVFGLIVPFAGMGCFGIAILIYLVVKLYTVYKAFTGEVFRIPYIGNFVEKYV